MNKLIPLVLALLAAACDSAYYGAMEKIGVHKRDILVDRIQAAQDAQQEGQQQFKDALEQFRSVVAFEGGDLEAMYNKLNGEYEDSVAASEEITDRIDAVENVADALFDEWRAELEQYTNQNLRRESARELSQTEKRYHRVLTAMRNAERTVQPVLDSLHDNVLFLKHNLNARAIASLKGELGTINTDVSRLIKAMERAIAESNQFITELRANRQQQ